MSVSRSAGLGVLVFSLLSELPGVKCQYLGQQGWGCWCSLCCLNYATWGKVSVSRSAGLGVLVFSLLSELPGVKCQYLGQQGWGCWCSLCRLNYLG